MPINNDDLAIRYCNLQNTLGTCPYVNTVHLRQYELTLYSSTATF